MSALSAPHSLPPASRLKAFVGRFERFKNRGSVGFWGVPFKILLRVSERVPNRVPELVKCMIATKVQSLGV